MAEVDAAMEVQIARASETRAVEPTAKSEIESLVENDEDLLPMPGGAAARASAPAAAPAMASRMEQVEMFERKPEPAAADESAAARGRDTRAESIAKAQHIARSLGVSSLTDDEYDIPTFIRRQQQNNSTLN